MNEHEREIMFQTLELLRMATTKLFQLQHDGEPPDPKDVDDWVFSELPITVQDIEDIYKDKDVLVYTASAIQGDTPPNYDYILNLAIVRLRVCEEEIWADTYAVPLSADEANALDNLSGASLQEAVKNLILKKLHAIMLSKKGWKNVCDAAMDFNWGDAVQTGLLDEALHNIEGEFTTPWLIDATILVNQDELIAPSDVPVTYNAFVVDELVFSCPTAMDMTDGNVLPVRLALDKHGIDTKQLTRATVTLPNGDELECNTDWDFLYLTCI